MTNSRQRPRDRDRDARSLAEISRQDRIDKLRDDRAHLRRTLSQTAVATALIGVAFLLSGNRSLRDAAPFLIAWSVGWGIASLVLLIQRRVKRGRRSDER